MTITGTIELAGLDGGPVNLAAEQLEDLDSGVQGRLLVAGDQGWNEAVSIWNGMAAKLPALVLQPASAHDVAAAVSFAREHGLLLGIKGGGHNIAGTSMAPGGLTLDLSGMREVSVDPEARLAQVGPGCLLGDVDQATQQHGLATVLGFVSETGVAGLTLGGGWGYLARRFGFAVDNLAEVEVVTADGAIRTANRDQHPELFWWRSWPPPAWSCSAWPWPASPAPSSRLSGGPSRPDSKAGLETKIATLSDTRSRTASGLPAIIPMRGGQRLCAAMVPLWSMPAEDVRGPPASRP
jgi:hypothetical protein